MLGHLPQVGRVCVPAGGPALCHPCPTVPGPMQECRYHGEWGRGVRLMGGAPHSLEAATKPCISNSLPTQSRAHKQCQRCFPQSDSQCTARPRAWRDSSKGMLTEAHVWANTSKGLQTSNLRRSLTCSNLQLCRQRCKLGRRLKQCVRQSGLRPTCETFQSMGTKDSETN